jgi:tetratricopeptide (TPR) repeat protein
MWFENGDEEKALDELELANRLLIIKTEGAEASLKRAEEKVMEPERIRREIESWEKVLEEKPYYRDVLLRLALLNYQIYEDEKAEEYWQQANYLDPNNEEGQEVGEIIFSSP